MSESLSIASVVPSAVLLVETGFMPLNPQGSQESALLLQLTTLYREWLPQPPPVPAAEPPPVLSRVGPFDASVSPTAKRDHPLITDQQDGCSYCSTNYRDDHSNLYSPFGMQVHHPQFLEWVGATESACLLGLPHGEWLQVMTRQDTLHAALQLQ